MALEFSNAANSYAEAADVAAQRTNPLTMIFWVKLYNLPAATTSLFAKWKDPTAEDWEVTADPDGTLKFLSKTGEHGVLTTSGASPMPVNTWTLVWMHLPISGAANGKVGINLEAGVNMLGGTINGGAVLLRFGTSGDTGDGGTGSIDGLLEDVRIYNRELSGGNISAIYNSGVGGGNDGINSGLIARWPLTGTAGTSPVGAGSIVASSGSNNASPAGTPFYRDGLLPPPVVGGSDNQMDGWLGIGLKTIHKQRANLGG